MAKAKDKKTSGVFLLETAFQHARSQGINRIVIVTRKSIDWEPLKNVPPSPPILLGLGTKIKNVPKLPGIDTLVLDLPNTSPQEWLERCLQEALRLEKVKRGERLLCLFPLASPSEIDSLSIFRLKEKTEYVSLQKLARLSETIPGDVLSAAVHLAIEIAREGREGNPVGSLFVLGDSQKVLEASRPLILNPFQGYSEDKRRITDPQLAETVKEIAQIDGAFVIRPDGVILSAGRYLDTPAKGIRLPKGLGTRHLAAASISKSTDAIAITISSSTRTVRVFRKGKVVMQSKPLRGLWI
jgi:DNA integrity scanning protein DisA with diadenylate cyclase activity